MANPETDFDLGALSDYLGGVLSGHGPAKIEKIPGGMSNPTYFLDFGGERYVLRKQPPGKLLPSAHAIDREFKVLNALGPTSVPVPVAPHYCADPNIIGTPFYIMDRLDGRVFHDNSLPDLSPDERAAIFSAMNETLAALHGVAIDVVGLTDFGKHGDFFARQIARWSGQYEKGKTRDIVEIPRLADWLSANVPDDDETTLVHGDYRLGNLIFHPSKPEVIGVLDWELSTLGHPLSDLGYNLMPWTMLPAEFHGLAGLDLRGLGIPERTGYSARYFANRGLKVQDDPFYTAFAFFRLAVIFEGIVSRSVAGNQTSGDASGVAHLSRAFARHGLDLAGA